MTEEPEGTMADVSHAHPETRETFGTVYRRGPAVTDGGSARTDDRGAGTGGRTLADVDHEPPHPDSADVWTRGTRRRDDGNEVDG